MGVTQWHNADNRWYFHVRSKTRGSLKRYLHFGAPSQVLNLTEICPYRPKSEEISHRKVLGFGQVLSFIKPHQSEVFCFD